ncbi:hypothetical protein [Bacillus atrophaeus]|uniref:hypothetical protein n=1 Tax=Bacillus atrophaeus TaxID=1452 RepID=UPI0021617CB6|nr:hypothetical protein [Bacillus atrophaeus]MCY8517953.1 hypothetical protein [Bacillus atrophaeus]MCY8807516.1 hypothetical protein [Bacillus atrophaeus]MEC0804118.1 hypothetical protein [Bacillus atrophaeus]
MKKFAEREYLFYSVVAILAFLSLLVTDKIFFVILIIGILINTYYCGYTKSKVGINLLVAGVLIVAQLSWSFY